MAHLSIPGSPNASGSAQRVRALLAQRYAHEAATVTRAPGRLNLIGEHTDYNGGFVLPVAVDRAVYVAAAPRADRHVRAWSENMAAEGSFSLDELASAPQEGWPRYLQGVAWVLEAKGLRLRGVDAALWSDVPLAAGLSSSAALEVAWALALLQCAGAALPPEELALACQQAENEYVGMRCGLLDQFSSVFGRREGAVLIDCRSRERETINWPPTDVALVVCDTNKPRSLVDTEYNLRRSQCEQGAAWLGVPSLREAEAEQLWRQRVELGDVVFRRCWHVVTENTRVLEATELLRRGDWEGFGELLFASHRSLRDYYEVSCPELEAMWRATRRVGCLGSRLVGAGFGGAVMALVRGPEVAAFVPEVAALYQRETGLEPNVFAVQIAEGAGVLEAGDGR